MDLFSRKRDDENENVEQTVFPEKEANGKAQTKNDIFGKYKMLVCSQVND